MAQTKFRSVGGPKKYFKYSECSEGDLLVEGKYIGRSPNKFGNENFDFKPEDGGPTVCLNHAGHLAYLMDNYVSEGDLVQVVYDGKSKLEKGPMKGKEAHSFIINVADSNEQLEGVSGTSPEDHMEPKGSKKSVDLSDLD